MKTMLNLSARLRTAFVSAASVYATGTLYTVRKYSTTARSRTESKRASAAT
jgi:hypothetical protein